MNYRNRMRDLNSLSLEGFNSFVNRITNQISNKHMHDLVYANDSWFCDVYMQDKTFCRLSFFIGENSKLGMVFTSLDETDSTFQLELNIHDQIKAYMWNGDHDHVETLEELIPVKWDWIS